MGSAPNSADGDVSLCIGDTNRLRAEWKLSGNSGFRLHGGCAEHCRMGTFFLLTLPRLMGTFFLLTPPRLTGATTTLMITADVYSGVHTHLDAPAKMSALTEVVTAANDRLNVRSVAPMKAGTHRTDQDQVLKHLF